MSWFAVGVSLQAALQHRRMTVEKQRQCSARKAGRETRRQRWTDKTDEDTEEDVEIDRWREADIGRHLLRRRDRETVIQIEEARKPERRRKAKHIAEGGGKRQRAKCCAKKQVGIERTKRKS